MNQSHDPVVQRHRLRTLLRRARESSDMTQKDVAYAMRWSTSKIVRIELGDVKVSLQDVDALLNHYGVTAREVIDQARHLAFESRGPSRYQEYEALLGANFVQYLAWEASATAIRAYHPTLILGLLQTENYAMALLEGFGTERDKARTLWEVRAQRQDLHHKADPPRMTFLLDESSLHRRIGNTNVMEEQLEHLLKLMQRKHLELRVLPFSRGAYPGMLESFSILEFAEADLSDVIHLETSERATLRADEAPKRVGEFTDLADRLETVALSEEDSGALIGNILTSMTSK